MRLLIFLMFYKVQLDSGMSQTPEATNQLLMTKLNVSSAMNFWRA